MLQTSRCRRLPEKIGASSRPPKKWVDPRAQGPLPSEFFISARHQAVCVSMATRYSRTNKCHDRAVDEIQAIKNRYARRKQIPGASLYSPLDPYVCLVRQEMERALIRCLKRAGQVPVNDKQVLEVGCGGGGILAVLIRLGFQP